MTIRRCSSSQMKADSICLTTMGVLEFGGHTGSMVRYSWQLLQNKYFHSPSIISCPGLGPVYEYLKYLRKPLRDARACIYFLLNSLKSASQFMRSDRNWHSKVNWCANCDVINPELISSWTSAPNECVATSNIYCIGQLIMSMREIHKPIKWPVFIKKNIQYN